MNGLKQAGNYSVLPKSSGTHRRRSKCQPEVILLINMCFILVELFIIISCYFNVSYISIENFSQIIQQPEGCCYIHGKPTVFNCYANSYMHLLTFARSILGTKRSAVLPSL